MAPRGLLVPTAVFLVSISACGGTPQTAAPAAAPSPTPAPTATATPTPVMSSQMVTTLCQSAAKAKLGGASLTEYGWPTETNGVWTENGSYLVYPSQAGSYYCVLPAGGSPVITTHPS